MEESKHHYIETRIYDNDGDLIKMSSETVPGDYEYSKRDEQYLQRLEERREKRTIVEDSEK